MLNLSMVSSVVRERLVQIQDMQTWCTSMVQFTVTVSYEHSQVKLHLMRYQTVQLRPVTCGCIYNNAIHPPASCVMWG